MFALLAFARIATAVLIAGTSGPVLSVDTTAVCDSSPLTVEIAKRVIEVDKKLEALKATDSTWKGIGTISTDTAGVTTMVGYMVKAIVDSRAATVTLQRIGLTPTVYASLSVRITLAAGLVMARQSLVEQGVPIQMVFPAIEEAQRKMGIQQRDVTFVERNFDALKKLGLKLPDISTGIPTG